MTLRINGSTSGYTEIDAPAVAGSNTITLPTGNGTADQRLVTDGSGALSFSSDVMLAAGSAGSPSLYFSGDTNTGMWSPAADTLALSTNGSERIRFLNNGSFLHNTTNVNTIFTGGANAIGWDFASGSRLVSSRNSTAASAHIVFYNPNGTVGSISSTASATAYTTTSDYRLKENVVPIGSSIVRLLQLKPSRFNFIADPDTVVDGFIAHEAQAVVPECVTGTKDEVDDDGNPVMQGIDQSKLVPLLTAALQEALQQIEALTARVTALEAN